MADNKITIQVGVEGQAEQQFKKLQLSVKGFHEEAKQASTGIAGAFNNLVGPISSFGAALGIAGGAAGIGLFVKSSLDLSDNLVDLSVNLGVSTTKLQEWDYAAGQNGISTEQLNGALAKFNQVIGDAAQGNAAATKAFERLNVSITDGNGNLKTTEALFADVADKVAMVGSESQQAALLVDLFGKGAGTKLVQVFKEGSAGLDAFAEEARALGLVLDADMVKKAAAANDKLDALGKTLRMQLTAIAIEAAPAITALANLILDVAKSTNEAIQNMKVMAGLIKETFGGVADESTKFARLNVEIATLEKQLAAAKSATEGYAGAVAKGNGDLDFFIKQQEQISQQIAAKKEEYELMMVLEQMKQEEVNRTTQAVAISEEAQQKKVEDERKRREDEYNELVNRNVLMAQLDADRYTNEISTNQARVNELIKIEGLHSDLYLKEMNRRKTEMEKQHQREMTLNSQKLTATASFFGGMAALARAGGKEHFELWKKLATAEAIVRGITAVQYALANPPGPPFNAFAVIGATAAAAANVAAINSTNLATGITAVPAGFPNDSFRANLTSGERVLNVPQNRDFTEFIGANQQMSAILSAILARLSALEMHVTVNIGTRTIYEEMRSVWESGRAFDV